MNASILALLDQTQQSPGNDNQRNVNQETVEFCDGRSCYKLITNRCLPFLKAERYCQNLKGHLVSVNDRMKWNLLIEKFVIMKSKVSNDAHEFYYKLLHDIVMIGLVNHKVRTRPT